MKLETKKRKCPRHKNGEDFSTFHIIKLETVEIIGEYQGKPTPDMFANMLNQVGREFGVTRERIRQIEAKALRKLRHPSRSKKLRSFIES